MANIKSAKKRVKTSEKARLRNVAVKSRVRTQVKKVEAAIAAKDEAQIKETLPQALSELDRAASKGVLHRKSVGRKKGTLQKAAIAATK